MNVMYKIDLQFFAGEKTEKATPQKRKEARQKGQVARSGEISSAFIMLFVFITLSLIGGFMSSNIKQVFHLAFTEYSLWEPTMHNIQVMFMQILVIGVKVVLPVLGVTLVVGLVANYAQVGFLLTGETLKIKLERIDPIKGFKRIFSLRALVELAKSILKILFVGTIAFGLLWNEKDHIFILSQKEPFEILGFVGGLVIKLGIYVAILLIVLAIFDYIYQRYEHEKNLRMSKQDIKDEYKKTEGDPLIKGKIRERQRQMAMRRMMQEVPKADVVITNPTHYAIAVQYEAGEMEAPMVIAKGKGYVALKIREVATEHHVLIMENKPLARTLYQRVEIGESIPEDLFKAVAEVLAFVYRMKGTR